MPRIRLRVIVPRRTSVYDGVNPPLELDQTQVWTELRVADHTENVPAVVDTGAPLTIISKRLWSLPTVRPAIEWLAYPPGSAAKLPTLRLLGASYEYRVGRISMQPFDETGASLAPTPVVAQFLEDDPIPNRSPLKLDIVVGLTRGILDSRYLVVKSAEVGRREAWLQDERPVEPVVIESVCSARIPPLP